MIESLSKIPNGMRYYGGKEAQLRRFVEDTIMSVFKGWSYEEIITPSVDYFDLFDRSMGHGEAHLAFRFVDLDGSLLALRPEVTSSVARAAATFYVNQERPLRLCYSASVFRQQPQSHSEWRREVTQLGCELFGVSGTAGDIEVLAITAESLAALGLSHEYQITINHAGIFNGLAEQLEIEPQVREEIRHLIDIRDTGGLRAFISNSMPIDHISDALIDLTRLSGKDEVLNEAQGIFKNIRSSNALRELASLWGMIESLGLKDRFKIDLGEVSGLDYYTGLTFTVYINGIGSRMGRGGRYDRLTSDFGRNEAAVGFILELEKLVDALSQKNSDSLQGDEEFVPIKGNSLNEILLKAQAARSRGARVRIDSAQ